MKQRGFCALILVVAVCALGGLAEAGTFPGACDPTADNGADWCTDFETYAPGTEMQGIDGWQGWGAGAGDPSVASVISTDQNHTPGGTRSLRIENNDDQVRIFNGYDLAAQEFWVLTAWVFIPGDQTGDAFFIALPTYDGGGGTTWAVQLDMSRVSGVINDDLTDAQLPLVVADWAEIRCEINLRDDSVTVFYNQTFLSQYSWTEPPGGTGGGELSLQGIDLFSNDSTDFYYDDISLFGSDVPDFVPPRVTCSHVQYNEDTGCSEFAWTVRNMNNISGITTFYLDVETGSGGQTCVDIADIVAPEGFTATNCTGWVNGHAMLRFTGPEIAPGQSRSGRLTVDANGSVATITETRFTVPPLGVLFHGSQQLADSVCANGDFTWGPAVSSGWSSPPTACTGFLPVPSLSMVGKTLLTLLVVVAGVCMVLRSRRSAVVARV